MKKTGFCTKWVFSLMCCAFFVNLALASSLWAAQVYKVGAVFSITGHASLSGDPQKKTAVMIEEKVNGEGGINGNPLKFIIYDDEGDATKCTLAVKRLITEDKVLSVIGPSLSGLSTAVLPLVEQYEMPLVSCAASYKIVWDEKAQKPYKWSFKTAQSDSLVVEGIYTHMKKNGISKIAIMTSTDGFGVSGREELLRYAPKYGMTIVAAEQYGPKDTDVTAQLTKIRGLAPQAIMNWSIGPTQIVAMRNWVDLGMGNIRFYQSHGFGNRRNLELAAGTAEGVISPLAACNVPEILSENHVQKKVTMEYLKLYRAKYNEPTTGFGGAAWDAIQLVLNSLKTVGPDNAKIRDHLENTKRFVGQHGIFNFSPMDHNGLSKEAYVFVVVKKGNWVLAD